MIYGAILESEGALLQVKVHAQQELKWTLHDSRNPEFLARIIFEDSSEMVIPFSSRHLDHSKNRLFKLFIPTLKEFVSFTVTDTQSRQVILAGYER